MITGDENYVIKVFKLQHSSVHNIYGLGPITVIIGFVCGPLGVRLQQQEGFGNPPPLPAKKHG